MVLPSRNSTGYQGASAGGLRTPSPPPLFRQAPSGFRHAPQRPLPRSGRRPDRLTALIICQDPQHFLDFLPLPQGQGSFRPVLGAA